MNVIQSGKSAVAHSEIAERSRVIPGAPGGAEKAEGSKGGRGEQP
ncbi:MAG: hypothetical protein ACE5FZ_05995 [Nitrospiria bacterium]